MVQLVEHFEITFDPQALPMYVARAFMSDPLGSDVVTTCNQTTLTHRVPPYVPEKTHLATPAGGRGRGPGGMPHSSHVRRTTDD
jgi:hypothetical protein